MTKLPRIIDMEIFKVEELVRMLREDKFLIPTFQREFVWQPSNILKLWDSMYRFYPMGSILYWETDSYLHTHRRLGGFVLPHDEDAVRKFEEWKYILDGQQRATSLLVSMLGGKGRVEDNEEFDYTLYFDARDATFFFAGELEQRKKTVASPEFLVRVRDVPGWSFSFYKDIAAQPGFNDVIEQNLGQISRVFTDYKIPVVRVMGVQVNEVCEIFERINQEGKRLDPVDIIVARTYRTTDPKTGYKGFYLRDYLRGLTSILEQAGSQFKDMEDLTIIQMVALCLRKEHKAGPNPYGITPAALDNLTSEALETNWGPCQRTILDNIKFLSDQKIQGPAMLPFNYLALALCYYQHKNKSADPDLMRQWFWRNAFGLEEFRASSDLYHMCENWFRPLERGEHLEIPPLVLSKTRLVQASYNYRNALSRAVLAFLANQNPLDFSDPQAVVLDNVYLLLSQAPNLHHIYPQNFLRSAGRLPDGASIDSLMNICFIRARTNIQISDKNPLSYFQDFAGVRDYGCILKSHLIPRDYTERTSFRLEDYRDFLFTRAQWFAEILRAKLPDVDVTIVD